MIEPAILNDKKRRLDYAIRIVIGHLIAEAINEINLALDSNKSRWITIHPNGKHHKGRDSLQCIAYAIHIAAEDFPHILTTSVYEFGHFDHKYNEFQQNNLKNGNYFY